MHALELMNAAHYHQAFGDLDFAFLIRSPVSPGSISASQLDSDTLRFAYGTYLAPASSIVCFTSSGNWYRFDGQHSSTVGPRIGLCYTRNFESRITMVSIKSKD